MIEFRADMTPDEYRAYFSQQLKILEQQAQAEAEQLQALPIWDGSGLPGYTYPEEDRQAWHMVKDTAGNILYLTQENPRRAAIWCTASQLRRQLNRISQITT